MYLKTGSLFQILQAVEQFDNPPIMTTVELPLGTLGMTDSALSTDFYAWRQTEGFPFCNDSKPIPADTLRCGFVATKGSFPGWKLSPNGFGVYFDVKVGSLLLVIAKPKGDGKIWNRFTHINMFVNNFHPHEPNTGLWDLEGVVLTPGTRMYVIDNRFTSMVYPCVNHYQGS